MATNKSENAKIIDKAFKGLRERVDKASLLFLESFMGDLTKYAYELHIETGHGHHSDLVKDDFGWCIIHNGSIVSSRYGFGKAEDGRSDDIDAIFRAEASRSTVCWMGVIVSVIEPLVTKHHGRIIYSPRFEHWVFDCLDEMAMGSARDAFINALHKVQ